MHPQVSFLVPNGMDGQQIAETFSAYLLGPRAHHNQRHQYGPFLNDESIQQWQLDPSNDFWLREQDGRGVLTCRYAYQAPVLHTMVALFSLRMHLTDLIFGPGDYMLIDPAGQIGRLSQTEFLAQALMPRPD